MTKPRLVHILTSPYSTSFLKGMLTYMRERGFDVVVISAPGDALRGTGEREGITTIPVLMEREIHPFKDLVSLIRLYAVLRRLRPAIVNAATPKAGLLGMIAAWAAGVPVRIYFLLGLRLETTRGLKRFILGLTERCASAFAHRVFCDSESLRRLYLKLGLTREAKTCVLGKGSPNGIHGEELPSTPQARERIRALRARLQIPDGAPVIGFVGRIARDKGVPELLDAFDQILETFPDARLLMLGFFDDADPIPESYAKRLRGHPRVVLTGFVPDPDAYYAIMDVLAFPSYREGLAGPPLEAALVAEIPSVAFEATGTVDAVCDGVTGTIVPLGDVAALARALERYLTDDLLRHRHGRAGRQYARRYFSPEIVREACYQEYARLLKEARNHRLFRQVASGRKKGGQIYRKFGKRLFDLAITIPALILLSPVMAVVALLVRLNLGSPVLFRQQRPGLHGRPFIIYKFRSMATANDAEGRPLPDEQRLTAFGKALRRTSLDELPGLINVLKGELSLVGPRPLRMDYLERYTPEQRRRHDVLPGITGLAQVSGRNRLSWEERFALDVWYVDHCSPWLDFKILLRTARVVLAADGVSAPSHLSAPVYLGSMASDTGGALARDTADAAVRQTHQTT